MKKASLFLGICLALLVLATGCAQGTGPAVEIDAEVGVSAAVALTENRIEGLMSSMEIMALTDEVSSGTWGDMVGLLTQFEESSIPLVAWFVLPDGSYYTVDKGLTSANLADRSYFPIVMAGDSTIGDLVVSKSTGKKAMIVTVPVRSGGEVIGALGISIFLDELSQITAEDLGLSDGMVLYAVNGEGVIALHTDADLIMADSSQLGESGQTVSKESSLLGWTFTLA